MPAGPGSGGDDPEGGPGGQGAPRPGTPAADPGGPAVAGPFGDSSLTNLVILGAFISTVISLIGAFFLFGRRRRPDDDDELALASAPVAAAYATSPASAAYAPAPIAAAYATSPASAAYAPAPIAAAFAPSPAAGAAPIPVAANHAPGPVVRAIDPGTGGSDVDLPRWRRPSLMAARKSDPIRAMPAATSTFARVPGAGTDAERRIVRYAIVRLLDQPDEVNGATVGSLDEGDEVEVLERRGLYRRVATSDGRSGWLHKMTLGDLVEETEPEPDIEKDVLLAYLAGRGKN